jgi:hypothetical protein
MVVLVVQGRAGDPMHTDLINQLSPQPNPSLGTDFLGRDVLSRALHGGAHTANCRIAPDCASPRHHRSDQRIWQKLADNGIQVIVSAALAFRFNAGAGGSTLAGAGRSRWRQGRCKSRLFPHRPRRRP